MGPNPGTWRDDETMQNQFSNRVHSCRICNDPTSASDRGRWQGEAGREHLRVSRGIAHRRIPLGKDSSKVVTRIKAS